MSSGDGPGAPLRLAPWLRPTGALLHALGAPHRAYPVVHVTGTSRKGSTCTMIAAILTAVCWLFLRLEPRQPIEGPWWAMIVICLAFNTLGLAMILAALKGEFEDAVESYRQAIALDDTYAYQPTTISSLCGNASSDTIRNYIDKSLTESSNAATCALIKMMWDRGAIDRAIATGDNQQVPLAAEDVGKTFHWAVLLDGPTWAARRTVSDRDGLPVEVLETVQYFVTARVDVRAARAPAAAAWRGSRPMLGAACRRARDRG